jgi:hypothetical protein
LFPGEITELYGSSTGNTTSISIQTSLHYAAQSPSSFILYLDSSNNFAPAAKYLNLRAHAPALSRIIVAPVGGVLGLERSLEALLESLQDPSTPLAR